MAPGVSAGMSTTPGVLRRSGVVGTGGGGAPTTPADLASLVGWWDASDAASIVSTGGKVSQWNNKKAGGPHLIQATGVNQPATGTRTMNGKNVLDWNSSSTFMTSGLSMSSRNATFLVAIAFDNINYAVQAIDTMIASGNGGNSFDVEWDYGGLLTTGKVLAGVLMRVGGMPVPNTAFHVVGQTLNPSTIFHHLDSATQSLAEATTFTPGTTMVLGRSGVGTYYLNGVIGEIIMCDAALSDADRAAMVAYLTAKWNGPVTAPAWSPASLPGLKGWYDAADPAAIVSAGGLVSQLTDKSGGGRHMIQTTGANQPSTGTHTINGKNAIHFDDVNDALGCAAWGTAPTARTAFIVLNQDVMGGEDWFLSAGLTAPFSLWGTSKLAVYNGGWLISGDSVFTNQPTVLTLQPVNGVNVKAWKNGAALTFGAGGVVTAGGTYLNLGGDPPNGRFFAGSIGELIVCDVALSDADRQATEAYLMAKWTPPGVWSPAELPGLAAWYDASDLSTITSSAGKVSEWRPKLGVATAKMPQGTAALQPTTGAHTVNGLNVIESDGVDDRLVSGSVDAGPTTRASFYYVHAHNDNGDWGASSPISGSMPYGGTGQGHSAYQPVGGGSAFDTGPSLPSPPTAGTPCLYSAIIDATGCHQRLRHNGANVTNDVAAYSPTTFSLGGFEPMSTSNVRHSPMYACEMVVTNTALTGTDKTNLENYLMTKWGVT